MIIQTYQKAFFYLRPWSKLLPCVIFCCVYLIPKLNFHYWLESETKQNNCWLYNKWCASKLSVTSRIWNSISTFNNIWIWQTYLLLNCIYVWNYFTLSVSLFKLHRKPIWILLSSHHPHTSYSLWQLHWLPVCSPANHFQDCMIGPLIASVPRWWLLPVVGYYPSTSSVDLWAPAPVTSDCCQCYTHSIDLETEVSRPTVPNCGMIYHLYCDGQTWHFLFLSRSWKCSCLVFLTDETLVYIVTLLYFMRLTKTMYVCIFRLAVLDCYACYKCMCVCT